MVGIFKQMDIRDPNSNNYLDLIKMIKNMNFDEILAKMDQRNAN